MKAIKRWATIIVGGLVLATGLLLMPLPGPGGLPVTIAGLAILATELPWAKRLLERLKRRLQRAFGGLPERAGWARPLAFIAGLIALWIIGAIVVWRVWAS